MIKKIGQILLIAFFIFCFIGFLISNWETNAFRCRTKKISIKGVITEIYRQSNNSQIYVNNDSSTAISFMVLSEKKENEGLSYNYYYDVGDSIIKAGNTREVLIKNSKG